jgi:hypothetical protein
MGSGGIAPQFLTSALEWSGHARAVLTMGSSPLYSLYKRLGGSRSGCCGEEKNLAPARNQSPTPRPSSR